MLQRLLIVIIIPGACALLGLALAGQPWRRTRLDDPRRGPRAWPWGAALGFGAGLTIAYWQIKGWPALRARDGWLPYGPTAGDGWIPYLTILAALLGVGHAFARPPLWPRLIIRALVSITVPALILNWRFGRQWDAPGEVALALAILGGVTFLLWNSLSALAERTDGPPLPVALWAACTGAAATIFLAASAWIAETLGALAACIAAAALLSIWRRDLTLARGGVPVIAIVYAALLTDALYSARHLAWPAALLLAAAPSAAWITQLPPIRRKGALAQTTLALAATALVAGAAALIVYLSKPDPGPYGY